MALEYQRYGRNKETIVNKTLIESGAYKRLFDCATDNASVNKTLYQSAKTALKHRSGTLYEDMYWIDGESGNVLFSVVDSTEEQAIVYTDRIKEKIKSGSHIITLHTHPNSMPPSASDFNSCFYNKYVKGFVACHNGKLYGYTANESVNERIYDIYIQNHIKEGCSEFDAQLRALEKLITMLDIDFWEVTSNG